MEEYVEYYIAFLDILGFKDIINKKSFNEVNKIFDNLLIIKQDIMNSSSIFNEFLNERGLGNLFDNIVLNIMSDSIIIAIPARHMNSLAFVTEYCRRVQASFIKDGILIRGAITKGEFYSKNEIMFGKGLIEAYLLQENEAIYPRIIMTKKLAYDYIERVGTHTTVYIQDFLVNDSDDYLFVNYLFYENIDYEKLACYIKDRLDSETNGRVRQKYLWLKNYFNGAIENPVKYKNPNINPLLKIINEILDT